jgi:hypothetical protein
MTYVETQVVHTHRYRHTTSGEARLTQESNRVMVVSFLTEYSTTVGLTFNYIRNESNPCFICINLSTCQVPNLIDDQLQTLSYQQLVHKKRSYEQVVDDQTLLVDSLSIRILLIFD